MIINGKYLIALSPIEDMLSSKLIHEKSGTTFGLTECGYDVRIKQDLVLLPGEFKLASTIEKFTMPPTLAAVVHDKSTNARLGLSVFNSVIDPGFGGYLTLELANHSKNTINLLTGQGIAHILFHELATPTMYRGTYQNQPDRPVSSKEDMKIEYEPD